MKGFKANESRSWALGYEGNQPQFGLIHRMLHRFRNFYQLLRTGLSRVLSR